MSIQLKFGTFLLDKTNGVTISDFQPKSDSRIPEYVIPRMDGAYMDESKLEPISVSMNGLLKGSSISDARTKFDALMAAINGGKQDLYYFDDRYLKDCQKESFGYHLEEGLSIYTFKLTFKGGVPFWVSTSESDDEEVVSSSPHSYIIAMGGNAYVKPMIIIAADQGSEVSNIQLENVTDILGTTHLDVGIYTQIRLHIAEALITIDGTQYDLEIPSNTVKLVHQFIIEPQEAKVLILDFDIKESVHKTGSDKYILHPTIKVIEE